MTVYRMDVIIEAKDDATIDGVQPHHPDPLSAAVAIQDTMADLTKHDHRSAGASPRCGPRRRVPRWLARPTCGMCWTGWSRAAG